MLTGEILCAKALNRFNYFTQFPPVFREMVLDAGWDLQEGPPLHKPQLLQHLEPVGERFRADMAQLRPQGIKAHGTLQQMHDDQQHPHISQQTDGPS